MGVYFSMQLYRIYPKLMFAITFEILGDVTLKENLTKQLEKQVLLEIHF